MQNFKIHLKFRPIGDARPDYDLSTMGFLFVTPIETISAYDEYEAAGIMFDKWVHQCGIVNPIATHEIIP